MSPLSSIINRATKKTDRLNVITWTTHERYDTHLSKINADFYVLNGPNCRKWNEKYSKIPDNFFYVNRIPQHINMDAIISGNPFVHIPLGVPISREFHIPIINIFHTEPFQGWSPDLNSHYTNFFNQAQHHVFITEENKISWGINGDSTVIEHGLDTELFSPIDEKDDYILTVGNDFIGRKAELGFEVWRFIAQDLPCRVVGSTPGLSEPAKTLEELVGIYQKAKIYLNTTLKSPLPMSLCEAMACGLPIVTTNTNAICDYLTHGYDALIFSPNEPQKGKDYIIQLLEDETYRRILGENARKTALERFKLGDFVKKWENLLSIQCNKVYK